jgi:glutamine synthetase type III
MSILTILLAATLSSGNAEFDATARDGARAIAVSRAKAELSEKGPAPGALERAMLAVEETQEPENRAFTIRDILLPRMAELRAACDEAETATGKAYWPFPTYDELLFSVK